MYVVKSKERTSQITWVDIIIKVQGTASMAKFKSKLTAHVNLFPAFQGLMFYHLLVQFLCILLICQNIIQLSSKTILLRLLTMTGWEITY